ncbi:GD13180 [Drosophila simulans]|uniref:GD13180 n=1 Tax=Drosophila simulans TaxID=7240 RepID=B4QRN1_DROSI|nr:GD13180 [Drosophila simulans]
MNNDSNNDNGNNLELCASARKWQAGKNNSNSSDSIKTTITERTKVLLFGFKENRRH